MKVQPTLIMSNDYKDYIPALEILKNKTKYRGYA